MMNLAKSAGQKRFAWFGVIEKVERFQQGFGIGLGGLRVRPDDPRIAALLFNVAQAMPPTTKQGATSKAPSR